VGHSDRECCHIIDNLYNCVTSVMFSPTNPKLWITRPHENTIQQWDTKGHQIGPTYKGTGVTFSPDGTHFVLWGKEFATIRNSNSGAVTTTICAPNGSIKHCCFSPDGRFMAGASGIDAYVWDITGSKPCLIETFVGHTNTIISLIFSSSLIPLSLDGSIRFWQIDAPSMDKVATDSGHTPSTSASIISINLQEKDGIVISCDRAGVVRTWDTLTGLCKASLHTSAISSMVDMRVVDNRLIIVWHTFGRLHIWDTKQEQHLHQVKIGLNSQIRISGDGSKVFLLHESCIQALSTQTGEVVGEVTFEDQLLNKPLIVDGSRVWAQTSGLSVQGWDFRTLGSTPIPLSDQPPEPSRPHLQFINGNKAQHIGLSWIKDTITGEEVYQLPKRYWNFTTAKCDGQYLVTGYESGEVMILDFKHMTPQ